MIYDGQIEVEISGTFYREQAERGPSYSSGGEPGYPAHVEDIVAKLGRETIELTDEDMERAEVELVKCGRGE
jgi:hypothetical protein